MGMARGTGLGTGEKLEFTTSLKRPRMEKFYGGGATVGGGEERARRGSGDCAKGRMMLGVLN